MVSKCCFSSSAFIASIAIAFGASLGASDGRIALVEGGEARHQIILADDAGAANLNGMLEEAGVLFGKAYGAAGVEVEVVRESERDINRPGIFLGATDFAAAEGIDTGRFEGWSYIQRAVGDDIIIIGRDSVNPQDDGTGRWVNPLRGARMGTAKGVADFLHDYMGVRFLYPAGDVGIEIDVPDELSVPVDLDRYHKPVVLFNFCGGFSSIGTTSFRANYYALANNLFPNAEFEMTAHSYPRAIRGAQYRESNPEYFALIRGERMALDDSLSDYQLQHFCISNPEVQELIYQDALRSIDSGFDLTVIAQQDGFRPCQCEECFALYDTGADWSEKLWIFHRNLAERLQEDRPDAKVMLLSYGPTWPAPKTFDTFPDNVIIWLSRTTPPVLADWERITVPGGYASYLYSWGTYRPLGYTPQQTPLSVARTVELLHEFDVAGVYLDGFGHDIGLQAPVFYVYGRLLNNPESRDATEILEEFYQNAFGAAAVPMRRFYDTLFHALDYYVESPLFYTDLYGRERRYSGKDDAMRALQTVYAPEVLEEMETQLALAESMNVSDAVRSRIALARLEFDYTKLFATIAHLDSAYRLRPDYHSRERLLDAVDEMRAHLGEHMYRPDPQTGLLAYLNPGVIEGWPEMRPFLGHTRRHIIMPRRYTNTPMSWDTEAMRRAPLPGAVGLEVVEAATSDEAGRLAWRGGEGIALEGGTGEDTTVTLHTGFDRDGVFFVFTGQMPAAGGRIEAVEAVIDPTSTGRRYYRFGVGHEGTFDAAFGLIDDNLHPLFGREDRSWTGDWQHAKTVDAASGKWAVLIHVPYSTIDVAGAAAGDSWRGNFGVTVGSSDGSTERFVWSAVGEEGVVTDINAFGTVEFTAAGGGARTENPVTALRQRIYADSFEIHDDWQTIEDPIPGFPGRWLFREDLTDSGEAAGWAAPDFDASSWIEVAVPAFLAETPAGQFIGHGWYRTEFTVPEAWRGSPVEIHFGGVDEQAWVYVNGSLLQENSTAATGIPFDQLWDAPFTVTISPELLNYGGRNVLAVKFHASAGNSGIWRPVLGRKAE